jgi:serine/threonine protein kinase
MFSCTCSSFLNFSKNSCQYICRVYGYTIEKKTLTIVMEYMEKGDLFSILEVRSSSFFAFFLSFFFFFLNMQFLQFPSLLFRNLLSIHYLFSWNSAWLATLASASINCTAAALYTEISRAWTFSYAFLLFIFVRSLVSLSNLLIAFFCAVLTQFPGLWRLQLQTCGLWNCQTE